MLKSKTPVIFILANVAVRSINACTNTIQDEDFDSSSEPSVPERKDSPTDSLQ